MIECHATALAYNVLMRFRVASILIIGLITARPTNAQTFAGAAWLWSRQNTPGLEGFSNPSIPQEGIGGETQGFSLLVGGFLARHIGWGIDVILPSETEYAQTASKYRTRGAFQDRLFSGLVRLRAWTPGPEWLVGLTYVHQELTRDTAFFDFLKSAYGPFPGRPISTTSDTFGLTLGVDMPLRLAARVSVVPQVRLHLIRRDDSDPTLGMGGVVVQPAIGGRIQF